MKIIMSLASGYFFAVLLLFGLVMSPACAKEKPRGQGKAPAVNPYSADSVFEELRQKLKKDPRDVDSLYHLADLYERNGQYAEAIETYRSVIRLKPDMGYVYFKMGTAYDRLNKPTEAVAEFKKALRLIPKNPVLHNNMGVAYGKLGRYHDEIASLKRALQLRPSYSSARYNLGVTYLKIKDRLSALKEYEKLKTYDEGAAAALKKEIDHAS